MPLWQKGLNALFQSVTLRTAGFDSIGQGGLSDTSKAMSCVLMLIGGSSGSTAGGLKTATVGVLLLALRSGLMGREQVTFRGRAIHYRRVLNAMTLALVVLFVFVFSSMVVSTVEDLPYLDSAFEVASAMGTVGLTTGITPTLTPFSQGPPILLMAAGLAGHPVLLHRLYHRKQASGQDQIPWRLNVSDGLRAASGEKACFTL